jgi:hypothetical protein
MRRLFALSLILVAAGTGCRICASPYDYCGPVVDDCCCGSDYQPQTPYHGPTEPVISDGESAGEADSTGPVYYEGNKSTTPKTATKSTTPPRRTVPAASLPRQAKRPKGILTS